MRRRLKLAGQPVPSAHRGRRENRRDRNRRQGRGSAPDRARALAGRPSPRPLQAPAQGVPGPLDERNHRVPGVRRVLVGDQGRRRARGEPRLADLLLRTRRHHRGHGDLPAGADAGDVHRHGPAQARPDQGAFPGRLHAEADRRTRGGDQEDRRRRPRSPRRARDLRSGRRPRPARGGSRDRQLHGDPDPRTTRSGPS